MISRDAHDEQTCSVQFEEGTEPGRRCVFVFWRGGASAFELPVRGALTLGRATDCEIVIDHPSVSRKHVALHVDHHQILVEDLGSSNGTRVSGRRLEVTKREPLPEGSLVEIGLATVVVHGSISIAAEGASRPADEGDPRATGRRWIGSMTSSPSSPSSPRRASA